MRIRRLKLANFRSVAEGEVLFPGHTVIVGGNSVGKSTLCEALDLLLGPDRLSRSSPIDEHDFFERRYLDGAGVPILIELEVVLTDLTEDALTKFRIHLEYWDTAKDAILDATAAPEVVDDDDVVPALRIKLEGAYDIEEDEFRAECYFASTPVDDETRRVRVTRAAKRQFGFIYLRALRTGATSLIPFLRLEDPEILNDRLAEWQHCYNSDRAHDSRNGRPPTDRVVDLPRKSPLGDEIAVNCEPSRAFIMPRNDWPQLGRVESM